MKKNHYTFVLLVISIFLFSAKSSKHIDTFSVDVSKSSIQWTGEKVTGKHSGTIKLTSGELKNDHGKMTGKFTIDMNSIQCTDLQGEGKTKLEGHLKADDFFGVKKYPVANFEIVSVSPLTGVEPGKPNFLLSGKLTLKSITNPVSFPVTMRFNDNGLTASGTARVDRSKFDIRYGSKTFFADIGDKAIYDEFTLELNITANRR